MSAAASLVFPFLRGALDRGDWEDRALCAETDPDLFFPGEGGGYVTPKNVCAACEVRGECLTFALPRSDAAGIAGYGIWGGLGAGTRQDLLRAHHGNVAAAVAYALANDMPDDDAGEMEAAA